MEVNMRDNEIAAVIAAAVAAMETQKGVRLVVRSFKRLPQVAPAWNTAGRLERLKILGDR